MVQNCWVAHYRDIDYGNAPLDDASNLIAARHTLQLLRTSHRFEPRRTLRGIQLNIWLRLVEVAEVVQDTDLDHFVLAKGRGFAPHVCATVSAEGSGDIGPGVSLLGPRLGLARCDLETVTGHDDVGAVGRAAHLLAVGAVAQGLGDGLISADYTADSGLDVSYIP